MSDSVFWTQHVRCALTVTVAACTRPRSPQPDKTQHRQEEVGVSSLTKDLLAFDSC